MKTGFYTLRASGGVKSWLQRYCWRKVVVKGLEKTRGYSHWRKSELWVPGLDSMRDELPFPEGPSQMHKECVGGPVG